MKINQENIKQYSQKILKHLEQYQKNIDLNFHLYDLETDKGQIYYENIKHLNPKLSIHSLSQLLYEITNNLNPDLEILPPDLREYILQTKNLYIDRRLDSFNKNSNPIEFKEKIHVKKRHEINQISNLIFNVCEKNRINCIIDVGSGVGYLSRILSSKYQVISIECCAERVATSKQKSRAHSIIHINARLDSKNFESVLERIKCSLDIISPRFLLTGLHACGDLSSQIMPELFIKESSIIAFVSVGCCYHLMSFDSFPLSKSLKGVKMEQTFLKMASQTIAKFDQKRIISMWYGHTKRVMAQVSKGFQEKLHVKIKRPIEKLKDIYDDCDDVDLKVFEKVAFVSFLKGIISPLYESILLVDRFLFLLEYVEHVELIPLFDQRISPRNMVFLATKMF